MAAKIEASYKTIMNNVRSSGLHFCLQETPFSCYITVRKSLINPKASHGLLPDPSSSSLETNRDFDQLKSRNFFLENSNIKLKQSLQDAVEELEEHTEIIDNLKSEVKNLTEELKEAHDKNDKAVQVKVKAFKEEKRMLQVKHENLCAEVKSLKTERDDLKKDLNANSVAIKSLEKENKETSKKFKKQVDLLETKIKALEEYKANKVAEEKELKAKVKKADRKLKSVLEKEAKITIANKKIAGTSAYINDDQNNLMSLPLENISMVSFNSINNINTFPSIVAHWLPPPATPNFQPLMDTTCSLETITSLQPTNSNLDTTSTSVDTTHTSMDSLVASSSLDRALTNYDEERQMLTAALKILEDMNKKF